MTSGTQRAQPPNPSAERRRSLARAGFGLCVLMTGGNLLLMAYNWRTQGSAGLGNSLEVASAIAYASLAAVGSAMILRRPHNLVGWVFLVSGTLLAGSALASEYRTYGVLTDPGALPAVRWVTWAGAWGWWAGASFGVTFGLMLYPDGVLPSPRWRVVAVGGPPYPRRGRDPHRRPRPTSECSPLPPVGT